MKPTIHQHQLKTVVTVSKKSIIALAVFMSLLLSACSKDSGSTSEDIVAGKWKLVNVKGTFAGIDNDFESGLITWTFNPITHTVTIVNNNTDPNLWDMFDTGIYDYQIVDNPDPSICPEILKIDGTDVGCFSSANDSLLIDQSVADGYLLTLVH